MFFHNRTSLRSGQRHDRRRTVGLNSYVLEGGVMEIALAHGAIARARQWYGCTIKWVVATKPSQHKDSRSEQWHGIDILDASRRADPDHIRD